MQKEDFIKTVGTNFYINKRYKDTLKSFVFFLILFVLVIYNFTTESLSTLIGEKILTENDIEDIYSARDPNFLSNRFYKLDTNNSNIKFDYQLLDLVYGEQSFGDADSFEPTFAYIISQFKIIDKNKSYIFIARVKFEDIYKLILKLESGEISFGIYGRSFIDDDKDAFKVNESGPYSPYEQLHINTIERYKNPQYANQILDALKESNTVSENELLEEFKIKFNNDEINTNIFLNLLRDQDWGITNLYLLSVPILILVNIIKMVQVFKAKKARDISNSKK